MTENDHVETSLPKAIRSYQVIAEYYLRDFFAVYLPDSIVNTLRYL